MLDETDGKILELLQHDARMTHAAIAQEVGLSAPSVYERVKKMEARGVIKGYRAIVEASALGRPITAFVRLASGAAPGAYDDFTKGIAKAARDPQVLECHSVAGEDCFILKVKVASPSDLESLLGQLRNEVPVGRTVSMIVLSTLKEETAVPIDPLPSRQSKR
jgi:Lrp/AsnC family leucine-responsive transcriptional regulator